LHHPSTTDTYTLSLHDALPICDLLAAVAALDEYLRLAPTAANAQELTQLRADLARKYEQQVRHMGDAKNQEAAGPPAQDNTSDRSEEHTSELQSRENLVCRLLL